MNEWHREGAFCGGVLSVFVAAQVEHVDVVHVHVHVGLCAKIPSLGLRSTYYSTYSVE